MRTLRLSLAGTVILMLVGVIASPASGQTDSDTFVTGTLSCDQAGERTVQEDDSVELHRFPGRCTGSMSDPRVSGISESDIEQACFGEAGEHVCMLWGATELTGPDGTWVGTVGSVHDDTLTSLPTWSVMEGTGAYEGWTYWMFTPDQIDPSAIASGIIYEGPPPPWGESLPLAPAE
jgi:hypothetical protein